MQDETAHILQFHGSFGNRLRRNYVKNIVVASSAYPKNNIGKVEKCIIDTTISNGVLFLISETLLCWDITGRNQLRNYIISYQVAYKFS